MVTDESMLRTRQVLGSPRRVELLDHLTRAAGPVTVLEAAEALGLHPNTARLHLEQLVEVGLVEQVSERRSEPGRPRALYTATRRTPADETRARGEDDYRALAAVLARGLAATDDPAGAALAAGEGWIEALADHPWPARPATAEVAATELGSLLDQLGFAPEMDLEHSTVLLRHCPFADVARTDPAVVCGVHLGMVRRTLERLDSPLRATRLEPFLTDEPITCRITLTSVDPALPASAIPLPVLGKKPVASRARSARSRT
jgi:predicted ArsR family transcriptional regulator